MCQNVALEEPQNGEDGKMEGTMIGVDLTKAVFQLHGASMTGHLKYRKKFTRLQFRKFKADQPPSLVNIEACGSAHYWARERLVHQRTELVNALRAVLYEFGHTVPTGIGNIKRIDAFLEVANCDLPPLVRTECWDLVNQIAEQTTQIDANTKTAKEMAATVDTARRFQTMPGVGKEATLLVAITLANKMARGIWAPDQGGGNYRDPALAVAAPSTCAVAT